MSWFDELTMTPNVILSSSKDFFFNIFMFAHIDADAFFASALQRRRPDLKGKPLLALGMGGGCVIAASYEAKAFGVKTGMRLSEARKLCPKAIALPSDFEEALLASRQIESILKNRCPLIEQYSVDEWFLDLRTLPGGVPVNLIHYLTELQKTVGTSVGLTVSIGTGPSKLLAKMASEYRKPAGVTTLCTAVEIEEFLRNRSAAAIPGIGPRRQLLSASSGWKTAWDIANADSVHIKKLFGEPGRDMQRELLGEAVMGIAEHPAPPKSVSRCRSFTATRDRDMVYGHLLHHLTYTMLKMRRDGLACRAVSVWIRDGQYRHQTYDMKLQQPMDTEEQLLPYIEQCFNRLWNATSVTQTGLALCALNPKGGTQFSLFETPKKTEGAEKIQSAMDSLHEKYGRGVIARGGAMKVKGAGQKKLIVVEVH